jgi:hypothetical protein
MLGQEEANWCWAAIIQAILTLRNGRSPSQQDLVTFHLRKTGRTYNCAPPNRDKGCDGLCRPGACTACCNDFHSAEATLQDHGLLHSRLSELRPPKFIDIQREIADGCPVPAQVKWNGGDGGHILLVSGWTLTSVGKEIVHILDPASAAGGKQVIEKRLSHDEFANAYPELDRRGVVDFSFRLKRP